MADKKKRLVLLDAHAIIHRAYHALPDFATAKGEPTGGLYGLAAMLIKLIADLKPDYLVAAYDLPGPTHRHIAYEGYKAKRPKAEGDLINQLKRSRDIFAAFNIPIYDCQSFEADDILGTIVEKLKANEVVEIIIASGDMDTLQLVSGNEVRVFTLRKGIADTIMYDEKKVLERFGFGPKLLPDYKGLAGDPSDNIIGVSGIGDKTATNLIVNFGTIEEIYEKLRMDKKVFITAGVKSRIIELLEKNEEEALFSKVLATIRRDAPIDFKLPAQNWREAVDLAEVKKIFSELEFRTLGARFEQMLLKKETVAVGLPSVDGSPTATEEAELGVILWLLDSTKTDSTTEEILEITKAKTASAARAVLLEGLEKKNLLKVFEKIEQPLLLVVKKMNERGILLNKNIFKKLSEKYHQRLAELEKKIWKLSGVNFNISSPKQLGEVLFVKLGLKAKNQKKTAKTGAFSTKESELLKLVDEHSIIPLILKHRELAKLLGTYLEPLPNLVDKEGRLHTTFIQAGTTTGRMASREPNLQNIPNKTALGQEIREGFVAALGFKLVSFDYSQMELRIAAFLSADQRLIEIFQADADVHTAVASQVFKVPLDEVTKEMRRRAKVINFGVMYGMGVNALRQQLGTDRKEAQKFYENYFQTFAGLAKYLDEMRATAARQGYTETYFGRRRYFEGLISKVPYVRAAAERMAINAPIQGTGADIIKIAMTQIDEFLRREKLEEKVFLLLQVHDELVYEIAESLVEKIAPEIKKIMEGVLSLAETKELPIVADVSVGDNWGEMSKLH